MKLEDVRTGRHSARFVNQLINHLTINPQSRIFALEQGDLDWKGWDAATSIAASTHNMLAMFIAGFAKEGDVDLDALLVRYPGEDDTTPPATTEIRFESIADFIARGGDFQLSSLVHGG